MTDLIPLIKTNLESEEVTAVDARTLHEFLEVKTPFKDWIARRLRDYDFVEGKDFCTFFARKFWRASCQGILSILGHG